MAIGAGGALQQLGAHGEPPLKGVTTRPMHRDIAGLVSFTRHADPARLTIHRLDVARDEFTHAESRGIEQLNDGVVSERGRPVGRWFRE